MSLLSVWQRVLAADIKLCLLLNGVSRQYLLAIFFRFISRISDGVFWYALMAVLPWLYGGKGLLVGGLMVVTGVINLWIYRKCKGTLSRERPFISLAPIKLAGVPLDRYSFPSGHTQHAVGFSVTAVSFFPELGGVLYPLALLVALSRPLLGLHYPSDVLVGGVLGYGVSQLVLAAHSLY